MNDSLAAEGRLAGRKGQAGELAEHTFKGMADLIGHCLRRRVWRRPSRDVVARIVADAVMVNVALVVALTARCVWLVVVGDGVASSRSAFGGFLAAYASTFWILTLICFLAFYWSGFYSFGRAYRGRYKILVVTQAVSVSYLVFGFALLALRDVLPFPRMVLMVGWLLTLVFLVGARLWANLWLTLAEAGHFAPTPHSREDGLREVLVIGGAGYIGSALVERLLERGYRVRVLDMLLYGDAPIAHLYGHPGFRLIKGDFRHIDTVVMATQGADAVVHLGAIVGDSACSFCEDLTIEINLGATRTLAQISKGFGIKRFVFASTCSVYGASDEILDERSALCPISLYARTKLVSEKVLLGMADDSFCPTILRFGTVYGLSGRPRFDLVVNLLTARAVQEGEAAICGGKQWRPLVHVRDVAESIVLALENPVCAVSGQIFNVGCNEQNYQIAELGTIIGEMVPDAQVVFRPDEDNRNYRVRFDKIHNMLNYQPQYTVRDGVTEILDAFAAGTIVDYRDPRYNNLNFLKQTDKLPQTLPVDSASLYQMPVSVSAGQDSANTAAPAFADGARRLTLESIPA